MDQLIIFSILIYINLLHLILLILILIIMQLCDSPKILIPQIISHDRIYTNLSKLLFYTKYFTFKCYYTTSIYCPNYFNYFNIKFYCPKGFYYPNYFNYFTKIFYCSNCFITPNYYNRFVYFKNRNISIFFVNLVLNLLIVSLPSLISTNFIHKFLMSYYKPSNHSKYAILLKFSIPTFLFIPTFNEIIFTILKHIICLFIMEIHVIIFNLSIAIFLFFFIPPISLIRFVFALFLILLIIVVILDNFVLITFIQIVNTTDLSFTFPKFVHQLNLILINLMLILYTYTNTHQHG